jgi:hypothetical protein
VRGLWAVALSFVWTFAVLGLPCARAEPAQALTWDALPSCVDRAHAQRDIELHLGRPLAQVPLPIDAAVVLRALASGFEVRISLRIGDQRFERVLRDEDCGALARAAAMVVALAIDVAVREQSPPATAAAVARRRKRGRTRMLRDKPPVAPAPAPIAAIEPPPEVAPQEPQKPASTPAPAPASTAGPEWATSAAAARAPEPAATPTPPHARPRETERARKPSVRASSAPEGIVGSRAAIAAGLLPGIAFPLELFVGLTRGVLKVSLNLRGVPPRWKQVTEDVGGSVALLAGALETGARLRSGAWELSAFAGFEAGRMRARSRGALDAKLGRAAWAAGLVGVELRRALGASWGVSLRARGSAALRRPRFAVDRGDNDLLVYYRPPAYAGELALGVDWRFP